MFDSFTRDVDGKLRLRLPYKFQCTLPLPDIRYKVYHGGRHGGKSWSIALWLVVQAMRSPLRVLCTRELQNSINDSVHRILVDMIVRLKVEHYFIIEKNSIRGRFVQSEFIFKGTRANVLEIKSMEGVDICWVEEGQSMTLYSWQILDNTLRSRPGCPEPYFLISLNPETGKTPFEERIEKAEEVAGPSPSGAYLDGQWLLVKVGWEDNPWFTAMDNKRRLEQLAHHPEMYDWTWNGLPLRLTAATIFDRNVVYDRIFEAPPRTEFRFGVDWGFKPDPTCMIRCFIRDCDLDGNPGECLYVDYEAYAKGIELDDYPVFFGGGVSSRNFAEWPGVPECRNWPIKADSARPELISYTARMGFAIRKAAKWDGSVKDGIAHLKGFKRIYIHPRCPRVAKDFRLYSMKVDPQTNDVLPIILDKDNHGPDAVRYALDGFIQRHGATEVWRNLGRPS